MGRWWTYQRERFPIFAHGLLIAAFSFSTYSYASLLRGKTGSLSASAAVVAFLSALLFFLQLRIADEFKDFDEDSRYRPYRPVPRGLIKLVELRWVGLGAALMQLALGLWLRPGLALLLIPVWLFLALMSREFFMRRWLKARPFTYMWTHMLIMPLIDLYVSGCDWRVAGALPPAGLAPFLGMSFFNGIVLEIGRKIRVPEDEEPGVETYSFLWGRRRAVGAWMMALAFNGLLAWKAASQVGSGLPAASLLCVLYCLAGLAAWRFLRQPVGPRARGFEAVSGLWTILTYLTVGTLPRVIHLFDSASRHLFS